MTPVYQWKLNGINSGTNSSNFSYSPQPGDSIRCEMTSNLACISGNPALSNKIVMVAFASPVVTFTNCFDSITILTANPIRLKGGIPIGGTYSGPGVNSSTGVFIPSAAGTGLKTIIYTYTNVYSCSANKSKTILVQADPAYICGNNLTDIRDNKLYPTVEIGSQCWMAKNLDFGFEISDLFPQTDNCIAEKYIRYSTFVNQYSIFYQWDELMQYQTSEGSQGLCPPGWHVPTENDWTILFNYYQGNSVAGKPLQDSNINGFKALRSGVFYLNSSWNFIGFATLFWSSTSLSLFKSLSYGMNTYNYSVSFYPSSRANAFPVRCLRN